MRLHTKDIEPNDEDKKKIEKILKPQLSEWKINNGYDLEEIMQSVLINSNEEINKRHFPNGKPIEYKISFTSKPIKTYFGICRYSDKTIKVNNILNSPDVPRFAIEFLVYHELLHTDLPNNGHDKIYRERERQFVPSETAKEEAKELGFQRTDEVDYYWYVVSKQFLDTMHVKYEIDEER